MTNHERQNVKTGLLFISPWMIGFVMFSLYPIISSFYYSLCDYSVLSKPVFIGAQNYKDLATDELFWKALYNTFFFAAFSIPIGIVVSLSLAILLNFNLPGKGMFRTIFFLPSLVPMVCLAVLWQWLLNGRLGLINYGLKPFVDITNAIFHSYLTLPNWLQEAAYTKFGLIFAGLWGVGNAVVIYLAGLQDVPRQLYESADLDGAGFWRKTLHITVPMISPVIYFNGIMALIGSFQVFAIPYVMMNGGDGPERSLLFVATYVYQNAFDYWNMGYACALGLNLFLIILCLTWLVTKLSQPHIYYAGK
ncbi:MAG: sugar ABC transporter permease [Verrucomicrobiae bacterium]|nr:sugar ABC transporter permease [Verrucomicrobiae bacterium]